MGIAANYAENDTDYVYIDCFGRYAADQEALSLTYFPENQGLPSSFFPYTGGNSMLRWLPFRWIWAKMRQHVARTGAGLTSPHGAVSLFTLSAGLGLMEWNTEPKTRLAWSNLRCS